MKFRDLTPGTLGKGSHTLVTATAFSPTPNGPVIAIVEATHAGTLTLQLVTAEGTTVQKYTTAATVAVGQCFTLLVPTGYGVKATFATTATAKMQWLAI